MFCEKCGKEIADNVKFCPSCGNDRSMTYHNFTSGNSSNTVVENRNDASKEKSKKKKNNVLIVLFAVVACGLFGRFVIAPAMLSGSDEKNFSTEPSNQFQFEEIPDNAVSLLNPEYSEIFADNGIADLDTTFRGLESDAYVIQTTEGAVEKIEFGYEDDIVQEMVSTMYFPISNLSEEEIKDFETELKSYCSPLEKLGFCKVTHTRMNKFYCITVAVKGLDETENVEALAETEFFSNMSGLIISMELTEEELLDEGYVKKYVEA